MRLFIASILSLFFFLPGRAQYYYKDQILTRETAAQWQIYHDNKVKNVKLNSFEADGNPSEGFQGGQEFFADENRMVTRTRSSSTPDSWILASYTPAGWPRKIVDTSDTYQSTSDYQYDLQKHVVSITNTSLETDNKVKETEAHRWTYGPDGKPVSMLKIRNGHDTTFVTFVADEKGNIAEERARRNGKDLPTVYYYYDDKGRLTDIVRYSAKAGRLLPDYVFEYEGSSIRPATMLVVPETSNDYQKWYYTYDDKGLKTRETCTNKKKQVLGSIEFQYTFNK